MPERSIKASIVRPMQAPLGISVLSVFALTPFTLLALAVLSLVARTVSFPLPSTSLAALHLITTGILVPCALAADVQLTLVLRQAPSVGAARNWWSLPLVWLFGNLLPLGFLTDPWLLVAAGLALIITAGVSAGRLLWLLADGRGLSPALRAGLATGALGSVLVLASGTLLALARSGHPSAAASLGLHLALGLAVAYVPLLIGVSGQLFPMFGHLAPEGRPRLRLALLAAVLAGGLLAAASSLFSWRSGVTIGAVVVALSIVLWVIRQEAMVAAGHGRLEPVAQGARLAAACLACSAAATAALLLISPSSSLLASALAFGLTAGIVGSILSYSRRILAFLTWRALSLRFGHQAFIPKLDALRPPLPGLLAPVLWTAGCLGAAVSLSVSWPGSLIPLAVSALVYALELGWGTALALSLWSRHRHRHRPD